MNEQNGTLLELFKLRKGITNAAKDKYWVGMLESCIAELKGKGVPVDMRKTGDICFVADYAVWRSDDANPNMPEWMKCHIRDLQIKGRAENC